MGLRDVSRSIGTDGEQLRLLESGGDKHQPLREDRTWDVRKTIAVPNTPDLLAVERFVRGRAKGADADELVAIADTDDERGRVRLIRGRRSIRLPPGLTGVLVQSDHERDVATVATENQ